MIAEITFSISFVTVIVRARLSALNLEVEEAAMDLGATRMQTLRLVVLPALWPAIIASALLIFALSFDDFVIAFFTTGESPTPLPVQIYSSIRFGVRPDDQRGRDLHAGGLVPDRRPGRRAAAHPGPAMRRRMC